MHELCENCQWWEFCGGESIEDCIEYGVPDEKEMEQNLHQSGKWCND